MPPALSPSVLDPAAGGSDAGGTAGCFVVGWSAGVVGAADADDDPADDDAGADPGCFGLGADGAGVVTENGVGRCTASHAP